MFTLLDLVLLLNRRTLRLLEHIMENQIELAASLHALSVKKDPNLAASRKDFATERKETFERVKSEAKASRDNGETIAPEVTKALAELEAAIKYDETHPVVEDPAPLPRAQRSPSDLRDARLTPASDAPVKAPAAHAPAKAHRTAEAGTKPFNR